MGFPFRAILDVGLARTTTGAKIFGVMKGVVDGGIAVPHKPNRFPGFNKAKGSFNSKILRERIFGGHVANWMKKVADKKKENPDQKVLEFSKFGAAFKPADVEGLYKKVHEAIRSPQEAQGLIKIVLTMKNTQTKHDFFFVEFKQREICVFLFSFSIFFSFFYLYINIHYLR